jgi:hypothetical protein
MYQPMRGDAPKTVENVAVSAQDLNPGEWYLDRAKNEIVYAAMSDEEGQALADGSVQATAAVEEVLLNLNRTSGHTWSGVSFQYATWLRPGQDGGFVEQQSAACDLCPPAMQKERELCGAHDNYVITPGNVVVTGGKDLSWEKCSFTHLGAYAVQALGGSQGLSWKGCLFEDVSAGALMLGDVTTWNYTLIPESESDMGFTVTDNT